MGLTRPPTEPALQPARWIRNESLAWVHARRHDKGRQLSGQYKSPGLNGNKTGASIFGRAARYTRNSSGRLRPEWVQRL